MFLPESHAFPVLLPVEGYARPAVLLAEGVPHHRHRVHGGFVVVVLRLDRDDAEFVVDVRIRVLVPSGFVFFLNLRLAVQDDVKILGLGDGLSSGVFQQLSVDPAAEDWQFGLAPGFVAGLHEPLVVGGDSDVRADGVREVLDEQVLAKRSVPVVEAALLLGLQVVRVYPLGESVPVEVDEEGASSGLELPEAEGVHHYLESRLHYI